MRSKDKIVIGKINRYCAEILMFVEGMTREDFLKDIKTNRACAITMQQIGELSKRLSDDVKSEYSHIPWKDIRGMRNFIVHEYEDIDWETVWQTINESIPELLNHTEEILKDA